MTMIAIMAMTSFHALIASPGAGPKKSHYVRPLDENNRSEERGSRYLSKS